MDIFVDGEKTTAAPLHAGELDLRTVRHQGPGVAKVTGTDTAGTVASCHSGVLVVRLVELKEGFIPDVNDGDYSCQYCDETNKYFDYKGCYLRE